MNPTNHTEIRDRLLGGLNTEQREAVLTIDRHLVIEAGAGSGKTSVLTKHYVWLLLDGATPCTIDQILLVTFTRKAAAEMQERVRALLQELSDREDVAGQRARDALAAFDRAWIGTFDGLCGRLLREYSLLGDLDPRFSILEEHAAGQVQRQTLETQLLHWEHDAELGRAFGTLYAEAAWYSSPENANLSEFIEQFCALYERIRLGTLGQFALDALVGPPSGDVAESFAEIEAQFAACRGNYPKGGPSLAFLMGCEDALPAILADAKARDWEAVIAGLETRIKPLSFAGVGSKEIKDLKTLLTRGRIDSGIYAGIADAIARPLTEHLATLLQAFDRAYSAAKQQLAALDFLDLNLRLHGLLSDPAHGWLVSRLRDRFRHVLVDEFQDTNRPQCALLEALGDLPVRGAGPPVASTLCVVGDPKQSIYAWRSADLAEYLRFRDESLGARVEAPGHSPRLIRLTKNYRSRAEVLAVSNSLLPYLQDTDDTIDTELFNDDSALIADTTFPPAARDSIALLAPYHEAQPRLCNSREDHAAWLLGQQLRQWVDAGTLISTKESRKAGTAQIPLSWGHIAILVRAASAYSALERQFRALGLPYTVVQGKGFFSAKEVQHVLSVLRLLIHSGDDLACAEVLRGPVGGVSVEGLLVLTQAQGKRPRTATWERPTLWSRVLAHGQLPSLAVDDREACARLVDFMASLRGALLTQPLAQVLEHLYDRSDLLLTVLTQSDGLRRYANLRQLQTYAGGYPVGSNDALRQFTDAMAEFELRETRIGEASVDVPGAGAITLMTMHGAKGLEWPLVVVHSLEKSPMHDRDRWAWDGESGLGLCVPLPGIDKPVATSSLKGIRERKKLREAEERLRLLYVAATRAEDRLLFTGMLKPSTKHPDPVAKGWLKGLFGWGQGVPGVSEQLESRDQVCIPILSQTDIAAHAESRPADEMSAVALPLSDALNAPLRTLDQPLPVSDQLPSQVNVTALAQFARCPEKYRFDQRGQLPGKRKLEGKPQTISASGLGQALHLLLARWIANPGVLQDPSMLALALLETGSAPSEAALAELDSLVQVYLAHELLAHEIRGAARVYAELQVSWWQPMPGASNGSRIYLQGKPDLLLETTSGQWTVVDYKTHSPRRDRPTLTDEIQLQLTGYALGVAQWQGIPIDRVTCLILARNEAGDIETISSPLTIPAFEAALAKFVAAHQITSGEKAAVYVRQESCRQCDYRQICPDWLSAQNH